MFDSLFGSRAAECCLLYIANYGESHINGIAKAFKISAGQIDRQLKKFEADGILVSRMVGNQRMFSLNPRLAVRKELAALLEKILILLPEKEVQHYYRERRRPRRTGKTL